MDSMKLTLERLRRIDADPRSARAPRLSQLAEFVNQQCGAVVSATCKRSWSNTDRQITGTRLRSPGKGRSGNKLTVTALCDLKLDGFFVFGPKTATFKAGQVIFEHDSSETYRYNGEAVSKVLRLVEQLRKG